MMNIGIRSRSRLAVGVAALAVPLTFVLAARSGNSPAHTTAGSTTTGAASAAVSIASGGTVKVPKYIAAHNVRKQVSTSSCVQVVGQGWRLNGTAGNPSSSSQAYSIVVDFVTAKGDTVLDTKILNIGPLAPKSAVEWSVTGAAGQQHVTCVIRQALTK
jgi:hypothetical protein